MAFGFRLTSYTCGHFNTPFIYSYRKIRKSKESGTHFKKKKRILFLFQHHEYCNSRELWQEKSIIHQQLKVAQWKGHVYIKVEICVLVKEVWKVDGWTADKITLETATETVALWYLLCCKGLIFWLIYYFFSTHEQNIQHVDYYGYSGPLQKNLYVIIKVELERIKSLQNRVCKALCC